MGCYPDIVGAEPVKYLINLNLKQSTMSAILVCFSASVIAGEQTRIAAKADRPNNMQIATKRNELKQLEKLPQGTLQAKANKGDPLAGLAMAQQFSGEAQKLFEVPVLANSAAEDAARWYSLAARMGALQSQSLNGFSLKPLRATRGKRR